MASASAMTAITRGMAVDVGEQVVLEALRLGAPLRPNAPTTGADGRAHAREALVGQTPPGASRDSRTASSIMAVIMRRLTS